MADVGNRPQRPVTWLVTALTALCAVVSGRPADIAVASGTCTVHTRVFAQRVADGRLVEIPRCGNAFLPGPALLVGDDDWRGHRLVTAVSAGDAVVFYTITADGELWWYRQAGPGEPVGGPVRLAADVDWSTSLALIVPAAGHLHTQDGTMVRTWAHPGWAAGGTEVTPMDPLLADVEGPPLSTVRWGGYAEGIHGRLHFRVWRNAGYPVAADHSDAWYVSGVPLPSDVTGVSGGEPDLYGLDGDGAIVWLRQDVWSQSKDRCPLFDRRHWLPAARSPEGGFARVVAPADPAGGPSQGLAEARAAETCGPTESSEPYEWH